MSPEARYERIKPLQPDFIDRDATAVEALGAVWRERIEDLRDSKALEKFNEQLYRRWAIETGILERLYSIDRGVTQVLVERGLDVSLIEHGSTDVPPEDVVAMLRDHRDAVLYVMDFVAGERELSLHFVRSIHQILTKHQDYVDAVDQFGSSIQIPLLKGDWKSKPNNPTRPAGGVHLYCPPELVQEEMENLLYFYNQAVKLSFPTTVISAWLHHRFTQIHPFQDGNGRVARALAAFVFVKRRLFPIVVEREDRGDYIDCLERADQGDLGPLIRLWNRLQRQSIESALSLSDSILDDAPQDSNSLLRQKLLDAIREQARTRRQAIEAAQMKSIPTGRRIYTEVVKASIERLRDDLDAVLHEIDGSYECTVDHWSTEKSHWFRGQVIDIAAKYGYFCDTATYHQWSRLTIRKRDALGEQALEIVISLHSLGRSFVGVLAMSGFLAERDREDDGRSAMTEPRRIADRPLSFTYAEPFESVSQRCQEWLDMALNVALERFRKSL